MKTVAFFNNKGGVGKTTLVYHLAWMFQELGVDVVAMDLDPQANLTSAFLSEERLEELWPKGPHPQTISGAVHLLEEELGDLERPHTEVLASRLALVPGDLALSRFEDRVAGSWGPCLEGRPAAFRVTTAFYRAARQAATARQAEVVLLDVGPSLGALNRTALVASDHVVIPLGADLFSLQGLRNLGPTLEKWRTEWNQRRDAYPGDLAELPSGSMQPVGYVILQHAVRADRPVKAYQRWVERIPASYHEEILREPQALVSLPDPHQLASLKHYRSLMPLAQDARKPMFLLKAADGAIGAHAASVQDCYVDFKRLALRVLAACGLPGGGSGSQRTVKP
jgi:cellulose biosynthesis protein BcsQ